MPVHARRSLPALLVFVLVLSITACAGGSPAQPASPTQTPTPTPEPLLSEPFLDLPPNATGSDVLERLPEEERSCIRDNLTEEEYQTLQDTEVFSEEGSPLETELDAECLSNESTIGLIVAGLSVQAGGLSDNTVRCIEGTFEGFDFEGMAENGQEPGQQDGVNEQQEGTEEQADQREFFGAITSMLLCLTPEEAERIELDAFGAETPGDLTLQDLRCVLQHVDINVLVALMGGDEQSTPEPEQIGELLQALQTCDVELEGMAPQQSP